MSDDKCRTCEACGASFSPVDGGTARGRRQRFCSQACGRTSGAPRKFSPEQEVDIAARYKAGESPQSLGKEYGCWDATIRVIVQRNGVAIRNRTLSATSRALIVKAWRAGRSLDSIAREVGCAPITVRNVVTKDGERPVVAHKNGPDHSNWKGGRVLRLGYVLVHVADDDPLAAMRTSGRYALEHRIVMARSLGRPLARRETVHHINGDKTDNRLANLQLRSGRHGRGQSFCCADCGSRNVVPAPLA